MIFVGTELKGVFVIELEKLEDERGFFARTYCSNEFRERGIEFDCVQCNVSFNRKRGTLRGMHFQLSPYEEAKVVRCTMGASYDVIVDLRPDSETFKQWIAVELTQENWKMIYIPKGFALGFQTLADNTEVFYHMSQFYAPDYARGFRWNDPSFNVTWPLSEMIISEKDQNWEDFSNQHIP